MKKFKLILGLTAFVGLIFFTACEPDDIDETLVVVLADCPDLGLNIGDSCYVSPIATIMGIVNAECECDENIEFDCEDLLLNIGDSCLLAIGDSAIIEGFVNSECLCDSTSSEYDCPSLFLNIGDSCSVSSGGIEYVGIVDDACNCDAVVPEYDCLDLMANFGDSCIVDPISGIMGIIDLDCNCQPGEEIFDCIDIGANIGDNCSVEFDGDLYFGQIDVDCNCDAIVPDYFCPELMLNPSDPCYVTYEGIVYWGEVNSFCVCETESPGYCPDLGLSVGDSCSFSGGMVMYVGEDCECNADVTYDCPDVMLNYGDSCLFDPIGSIPGVIDFDCNCVEMVEGVPLCPVNPYPSNFEVGVPLNPDLFNGVTLTWDILPASPTIDGYYFNLGTNPSMLNPYPDISSDSTQVTLISMQGDTFYYWQIIPFNGNGAAVGCTVWEFVTQ